MATFRQRVKFGKDFERREAVEWTLNVNPFKPFRRRARLLKGLSKAGIAGA